MLNSTGMKLLSGMTSLLPLIVFLFSGTTQAEANRLFKSFPPGFEQWSESDKAAFEFAVTYCKRDAGGAMREVSIRSANETLRIVSELDGDHLMRRLKRFGNSDFFTALRITGGFWAGLDQCFGPKESFRRWGFLLDLAGAEAAGTLVGGGVGLLQWVVGYRIYKAILNRVRAKTAFYTATSSLAVVGLASKELAEQRKREGIAEADFKRSEELLKVMNDLSRYITEKPTGDPDRENAQDQLCHIYALILDESPDSIRRVPESVKRLCEQRALQSVN